MIYSGICYIEKIYKIYHHTVATFLLDLGQKVSIWVLVDIISHSLSNIIKCTIDRYYKQKNLKFSTKNALKIMKKNFWNQRGLNQGPWDYEACMLVKSHGDLLLQMRLFHWCDHNSLISVVFCRFLQILVLLTSHLG